MTPETPAEHWRFTMAWVEMKMHRIVLLKHAS